MGIPSALTLIRLSRAGSRATGLPSTVITTTQVSVETTQNDANSTNQCAGLIVSSHPKADHFRSTHLLHREKNAFPTNCPTLCTSEGHSIKAEIRIVVNHNSAGINA